MASFSAMAMLPQDAVSLAQRLVAMPEYSGAAHFEVLMPMAENPVAYDILLQSSATEADTLSPCNYLIDWTLPTPSGQSTGFSAYYDGNHFRLRDRRLQEYHAQWDSEPFAPAGKTAAGVQHQAQFASLLPQELGAKLMEMAADSTYHATLRQQAGKLIISGVQTIDGYDCLEFTYTFDAANLMPLAQSFDYNPGQIGEQSVTVEYSPAEPMIDAYTQEALIARYPEAFGNMRESSFSLATLPGRYLPEFSAAKPDGSRLTHHKTDCFEAPLIIALLDADEQTTSAVISDVRQAIAQIPDRVDIIWAFVSNRSDEAESLVGAVEPGETLLTGARALARDCGAANTPALIFCASDGKVTDVEVGYNNQLVPIVIQKAMMVRYFSNPEIDLIEN